MAVAMPMPFQHMIALPPQGTQVGDLLLVVIVDLVGMEEEIQEVQDHQVAGIQEDMIQVVVTLVEEIVEEVTVVVGEIKTNKTKYD
jgi:hypothetical protein